MKTKHMLGWLVAATLLSGCSSISRDKEDDLIIITDKGLDIDDDKKFERPDDKPSKPVQPGDSQLGGIGDTVIIGDTVVPGGTIIPGDTIVTGGEAGSMGQHVLATRYIDDNQTDTALFEGNYGTIESHIVIRSGGILQIFGRHIMHQHATITIDQGGKLWVSGCLQHVELTIKEGGTLELNGEGCIVLASRGSLHLEPNSIIRCTGILYPDNDGNGNIGSTGNDGITGNDGWNIYAPSADPISSEIEKLDSLEIQQMIVH